MKQNLRMQGLYKAGARRFVVAGVGSMGCIPTILAQSVEGRCSEEVDQLVAPFNAGVRGMLDGLNAGLPGATFTYLDNYRLFKLMLARPASYGKTMAGVTDDASCSGIINRTELMMLTMGTYVQGSTWWTGVAAASA